VAVEAQTLTGLTLYLVPSLLLAAVLAGQVALTVIAVVGLQQTAQMAVPAAAVALTKKR
jgi:hypothetical protein